MSRYPQIILDRGYLYGVSDERGGVVKCVNWADGKVVWEAKDASDRLGLGCWLGRWRFTAHWRVDQRRRRHLVECDRAADGRVAAIGGGGQMLSHRRGAVGRAVKAG